MMMGVAHSPRCQPPPCILPGQENESVSISMQIQARRFSSDDRAARQGVSGQVADVENLSPGSPPSYKYKKRPINPPTNFVNFSPYGMRLYCERISGNKMVKSTFILVVFFVLSLVVYLLRPTIPKSIEVPNLDCESKREKDANKEPVFDVPVLFAVVSDCRHTSARKAIRKTWGKDVENQASRILFFVGHDDECIEPLKSEEKEYGDVIVLNSVRENYENLPLKTLEVFKHVARHHGDAFHFIAKCDDDVFVDHDALLKFLAAAVDKKKQPAEYIGFFHNDTVPMKKESCKWFDKDFEMGVYPPYAGGMFYMLSARIVKWISQNGDSLNLWSNEDSTVGTWLQPLNPPIAHLDQIWPSRIYAVGQTKVPVAIHVEWATGQGVQKGWSGDAPIADLLYKMQQHKEEYDTAYGVCEHAMSSNYHTKYANLYTAPADFSESRVGALRCS